jgi:dATP pyrophosphohydrolase
MTSYRRPVSVLVVVHTDDGQVLLLRRKQPFDFWQSVTGTLADGEGHAEAALRELREETGLDDPDRLVFTGTCRRFVIDPRWRHRYAPGVLENEEFEWRYRVPAAQEIHISTAEHTEYRWLSLEEAINTVWSWTNREALESLRG